MTVERLMAIALQTGRAKDRPRLPMFVGAGTADMGRLRDILDGSEENLHIDPRVEPQPFLPPARIE